MSDGHRTISQMLIPGANYWNVGFGREKGEVAGDDEGLRSMETLGRDMDDECGGERQ